MPEQTDDPKPDFAKDIAELREQNKKLLESIEKMTSKPPPKDEDPELIEKTRKENDEKSKKATDAKALEAALKFSIKSEEFLKTNGSLLPAEVGDIFKTAEAEKFESAIEKDSAIKSGIIQSFFKVQANHDLLTAHQKTVLDDYLKLTKTGKQEKAQTLYDTVFEPAFEMLKRVKKAEALNMGFGSNSDDAYKAKMIKLSKKHFMGDKADA